MGRGPGHVSLQGLTENGEASREQEDYPATMSVNLCVLLWPNTGAEIALIEYEDRVLELMPNHGARVLQRTRTDGADGAPLEIQILEFPSQTALDAYLVDERRTALSRERDAAIDHTEIFPVELV